MKGKIRFLSKGLLLLLMLLLQNRSSLYAQDDYQWQTDGVVNATLIKNNKLFLVGSYTQVGPYRGSLLAIPTSSTGVPDLNWPTVNNDIYCAVPDGSGGVFIGGAFTQVGAYNRLRVAHILADGSVDPNWIVNASSIVTALCLSGTTLYIGGSFSGLSNGGPYITRRSLAAVTATTGVITDWDPDVNSGVYAIAVSTDKNTVYAGGLFSLVNGATPRNRLAAFNANVTTNNVITAWNPTLVYSITPASTTVNSLLFHAGQLYVGGDFTTVNGVTRTHLAALDPTSGTLSNWNPAVAGRVLCMTAIGNTLYIGGVFIRVNKGAAPWTATGVTRNNIAAIDINPSNAGNTNFGLVTSWNPNANGYVCGITAFNNVIYVTGDFTLMGSPAAQNRYRMAALYISSINNHVVPFTNGLLNNGTSIPAVVATTHPVTGTTTIIMGGNFTSYGGVARSNVAAIDLSTSPAAISSWNPGGTSIPTPTPIGSVNTLASSITGDTIYIGGRFSNFGGQVRSNVAAISMSTPTNNVTAWNPGTNDSVLALAVSATGDTIYAGGRFTSAGGQTRNRIAALTRTGTGSATAWDANANGVIRALALDDGTNTLYAGGDFTTMNGGTPRNYIAALNVLQNTNNVTAWNPDLN